MKLNLRLLINIVILIAFGYTANAQLAPMYSQYDYNKAIINPAVVGLNNEISITALARHQWDGIDGAPRTYSFSISGPVKDRKVGIGFSVVNDQIGITNTTLATLEYSFKITGDKLNSFSFGLQTGAMLVQEDYASLELNNDPVYNQNEQYVKPNIGFGFYYNSKAAFGGLSVPNLIGEKESITNLKGMPYFFLMGYNIHLGSKLVLIPSALLKGQGNQSPQADFNLQFEILDHVMIGGGYREMESYNFKFGLIISDKLRFGYTYDLGVSGLESRGTHEIMLNYRINKKFSGISGNPRYFHTQGW